MTEIFSHLVFGVILGLVYGLLALGLVLIYKGTRTLNFAHPYQALLCAFLAWWLTARASFMPFAAGSRPRFAVAAVVALALIALNGYGIEHDIIRRLRNAPRLVVLVVTIALAQGLLGIVTLVFNRNQRQTGQFRTLPAFVKWHFSIGSLVVTGAHIQVLLLVPALGLAFALFFKLTRFGVAVRAAAENADSARLLGISVDKVSSFTWVAGSLLAGLAGLMITVLRGSLDVATLSTGFLVRALAAALIGGLTSLPGAIVGGVAVGISEVMLQWRTNNRPGLPETMLFLVVIAVLLLRPGGLFGQREETEETAAFVPTLRELPARLRDSSVAKWLRRVSLWATVVLAVVVSKLTGPTTNYRLTYIVVFAIVGVSLTILMGYTGQISLGHWALVGVGSFATANLFDKLHVPFLITMVAVVVAGMLVSLVIGIPAVRIRGLYLAVVTLGFSYACEFYLFKSRFFGGSTPGVGLSTPMLRPLDLDATSGRALFLFGLGLLLLSLWVAGNLARTRTGRSFFSLRENEKAAATFGVGLTGAKLLSFAVSGGVAALAGVLYAVLPHQVSSRNFETPTSLVHVAMVMIGGLGSLKGAVLGAFLVEGVPLLVHLSNAWIVPIGTGILLLVVIVRARGGLAGLVHAIRDYIVVGLAEPAAPATRVSRQ